MTVPEPDPVPDAAGEPGVIDEQAALELLSNGELEVLGRLVDASNATLYCQVTLDGVAAACVHKPVAGERPLWDFPDGTLAYREVATYELSAAAGWGVVPPTVMREGPWGPGMCQLWIDVDETVDLGRFVRTDDDRLRRIAVFDAVVNNADRKGGHLLPTPEGHVFGVDHGLTFALENKLRTLLWGWAGHRLPAEEVERLERTTRDWETCAGPRLGALLAPAEVEAARRRALRLLRTGRHPEPRDDGWPAVPWPPF